MSSTAKILINSGCAVAAGYLGYKYLTNMPLKTLIVEGKESNPTKAPVHVLITGAAGQIGYSMVPLVCGGSVFGPDQPIVLHLLDIPQAEKMLNGVVMEINDCAYPLLAGLIATTDVEKAFTGVHAAILVGGFPRGKGMDRKDLMNRNAPIFITQGKALNDFADRNVKVLVVANPANTNCLVAAQNAPSIPKKNFSCMTRLDENRAKSQLASKLGVSINELSRVIIHGNHSKTQYPDLSHALLNGRPVAPLCEEKWVHGEFITTVQNRGAAVIEARGLSSAMSAANAAGDHMRSLFRGTKGEWTSMGVYSEADGVFFSAPVTCVGDGNFVAVPNLSHDEFSQNMLNATLAELKEEAAEALAIMQAAVSSAVAK